MEARPRAGGARWPAALPPASRLLSGEGSFLKLAREQACARAIASESVQRFSPARGWTKDSPNAVPSAQGSRNANRSSRVSDS